MNSPVQIGTGLYNYPKGESPPETVKRIIEFPGIDWNRNSNVLGIEDQTRSMLKSIVKGIKDK